MWSHKPIVTHYVSVIIFNRLGRSDLPNPRLSGAPNPPRDALDDKEPIGGDLANVRDARLRSLSGRLVVSAVEAPHRRTEQVVIKVFYPSLMKANREGVKRCFEHLGRVASDVCNPKLLGSSANAVLFYILSV